jgi:phenylalanyl-tRNA synthetase beta chain
MRPTMLFSGLEAIAHNQNRQNADLKLFEFGKTYIRKDGKYSETNHLAIFISGKKNRESWLVKDNSATFYTLKGIVEALLSRLGLSNYQVSESTNQSFNYALQIHRGPQVWVEFGKVKGAIGKKMDIKQSVFYADFNWDLIMGALKKVKTEFKEMSKFPSVRRDLALVIDEKVNFEEIRVLAQKTAKDLLKEVNLFDVFQDENKLGAGKKSYAVSFIFEDSSKTLNDKDIDQVMNPLMKLYEEKLGAVIRK